MTYQKVHVNLFSGEKESKFKLNAHLLTATDLEVQLLVMMGINRGMCVC